MSNIQFSEINGLKIYNLNAGRSLLDIMKESNFSAKKLKKNEEYTNRIELIQDFEYPVASGCIKASQDGNYLITSGIYPPRLKIFDLNEMSLKVERGFDSEIVKLEVISDDFSKIVTLCEDRNIELHAQYGKHFKIRIPKYGRDLAYHKTSCDLFSVGSSNEIYRLNLFEGQFLKPFESEADAINACAINYQLELLGTAGTKGIVELWDLKAKNKIVTLPLLENSMYKDYDFTESSAITFSPDGFQLAVGNMEGKTTVYDLRNPKPLYTIKHAYRLPIKTIKYHESSNNIITVDKKLAKFSNSKNGRVFTNIEPKSDINDFETYSDTGMFFFATEAQKMDLYYIPQIGKAPKWCTFLENITEEMEESKNYSVYEDYKFVTKKDLEDLGALNLIGTSLIKPYMHGYFVSWKLYKKLKAVADPFAYDRYLEEKKENKLKEMLEKRIVLNRGNKVKSNSKLSEKTEIVKDSRFSKMFQDKNFEVDFNSDQYKKRVKDNKKLDKEVDDLKTIERYDDNDEQSADDSDADNKKIVNRKFLNKKQKINRK